MFHLNMLSLRLLFTILSTMFLAVEISKFNSNNRLNNVGHYALGAIALGNIAFLVFLIFNHINFPLNLNTTEGIILMEFHRAIEFKPIYPAPTSNYIPWAYNPLYFFVSIPFSWIFGSTLVTLRFVAVLGMLGSFLIVFLVIRKETDSIWWAIITSGLFAAAYHTMDSILDNARPDSLMLLAALLGTYLIDKYRSYAGRIVGVVVLCTSFWFKQHGALFALGGVLFLTIQLGVRRALPYWFIAVVLGPIFYVLAGPVLFGSHFHYFTWEVPRAWTIVNIQTFSRFFLFISKNYLILATCAFFLIINSFLRNKKSFNIWYFQLIFAVFTGFMGTLDSGSSDSNFIPMGTWFILVGSFGIYHAHKRWPLVCRFRLHLLALLLSFACFLYNPLLVIVSPKNNQSYAELINFLESLDGTVYAPTIGYMQDYRLYPTSNWCTVQDIARANCFYYKKWICPPGINIRNSPLIRRLLDPVVNPQQRAYILAYLPLNTFDSIYFLQDYYVLEKDLGKRFLPLRDLPRRWFLGWPRYLYRFDPEKAERNRLNYTIHSK